VTIRLKAALVGDLRKIIKAEALIAENAVTRGVRTAGLGLKLELRRQVLSAGLGQGIANAVRQVDYPKSAKSLGAAALVYSKAPMVHRVFEEGATIRAKSGGFLAIPTENVPRKGGGRGGSKRMSPIEVEARFNQELRFVPRKGTGPALLVLDDVTASFSRKTGRLRGFRNLTARRKASGRFGATVVMFILMPRVTLRKRLDFAGAGQRWIARVPELILSSWRAAP